MMPRALRELATLFLRLGVTAFGGPAAHTAAMEAEVVRRRGWLTPTAFLDLVSATQLVPGPNSTELAMHIGFARARWTGLLVAGTAFIVPAALLTLGVAWAYARYGFLPRGQALLAAVGPVVLAVVAHALWGLGRAAVRSALTLAIATASATAVALGTHELLVLGVAAGIAVLDRRVTAGGDPLAPAVDPVALTTLFGVFAKAGGLLFGSGYVLVAYLRADLVQRRRGRSSRPRPSWAISSRGSAAPQSRPWGSSSPPSSSSRSPRLRYRDCVRTAISAPPSTA